MGGKAWALGTDGESGSAVALTVPTGANHPPRAPHRSLSTETGSSSQGHMRTAAGPSSLPSPLCSVIRRSELLRTQAASGLRNSHPDQRRPPFYKTPQHEAANPMHLAQETSRIPKSKMQTLLLQVGVAALPCAVSIPRTALPAKAGRCS